MPVKLVSVRDIALQNGVKIFLYGQAGSGKTTLVKSVNNPLIISSERGLLSIADTDLDCIEVNNITEFNEAYQFASSSEAENYHCIYIDSISEIAEQILSYEKSRTRDPRKAYGELIEQMMSLIKAFRDLSRKHVVLIAKEEVYAPEGAAPQCRPSLPGSRLANEVPYLFDEIWNIRVNFDGSRLIQTQPDGYIVAKDRSGALEPKEDANLGIQVLIDKIVGKLTKPKR